jgi:hypothetical protein
MVRVVRSDGLLEILITWTPLTISSQMLQDIKLGARCGTYDTEDEGRDDQLAEGSHGFFRVLAFLRAHSENKQDIFWLNTYVDVECIGPGYPIHAWGGDEVGDVS